MRLVAIAFNSILQKESFIFCRSVGLAKGEVLVISRVTTRRADAKTMRLVSITLVLTLAGVTTAPPSGGPVARATDADQGCGPSGTAYVRTTLYFGLTRPSGTVSEPEWQNFLSEEVTPRFPDGLTVLDGNGQWRQADGSIARERSKALVIVHDEKPATVSALETLVVRYKKTFTRESVLWESARVCAAF
jgi:hypothetical protein